MVRRILLVSMLALIGTTACAWTPDIDRATLEGRYLDDPGDMERVAGVEVHVRESGQQDSPPIVMIHGFGSSLHTWEDWADSLDDEYRVIRFDMPGAGLSPPDPTGDYTDDRLRALLLALLDARAISRATLIGNSIGGRIAWSFAAAHPDRVERLVLVAPDGFESPSFRYGEEPEIPAIMHAMRYVLPRWTLRSNLEIAYADPDRLSDDVLTRYHDLLRAPGNRQALIERMEQTVLADPVPRLRTIEIPVLLLWGEEDAMIPVSNADDYLAALPNARLVSLDGLGHVPMEEDPAGSLRPVREFLAESGDRS